MTAPQPISEHAQRVWRYMSFGRFLWLLQNKRLWLSRADLLGDKWELSLAGAQLQRVIERHPITPLPVPKVRPEGARERAARIIGNWRRTTYVNCWSATEHESHALWRIFCPSVEGVAIQATLAGLRSSVGSSLKVHRVTYGTPGSNVQTPTREDLITKKRPMFDYEREYRIVHIWENATPDETGYAVEWHPDAWVQSIRIHPEADEAFADTVVKVVEQFAPALKERVTWSDMTESPPF